MPEPAIHPASSIAFSCGILPALLLTHTHLALAQALYLNEHDDTLDREAR